MYTRAKTGAMVQKKLKDLDMANHEILSTQPNQRNSYKKEQTANPQFSHFIYFIKYDITKVALDSDWLALNEKSA